MTKNIKHKAVKQDFNQRVVAVIFAGILLFPLSALADLNTGLVAHWSFDDCTAKDNSGNGHDGAITGNLECISGIDGKKAFHFKGSQYITTGYKQVNVTAYSVSAWVKIAITEKGGGITDNRGAQFSGGKSLSLVSMQRPDPPYYYTTFATHGDDIFLGKSSPKLLKDNVWHHLVGTWEVASGVKVIPSQFNLFIDGVKISGEIDNGANVISPLSGVGNLIIGRYEAWQNFFTGIIDNVRIYNRVLSASEVAELYTSSLPVSTLQATTIYP
jgi:hypothetical protein